MTDKNIQMKIKNGTSWDNLFPKTKAVISIMNDGRTVEEVVAYILTALGSKISLEDVNNEIKKIVGSAPAALDTLQELAAALNNDSNFAVTITNTLANKLDKVPGKQLSTEDFTTALMNKLNSLSNYVHPTGDGNLHVPATGTSSNGKFLKAGSTVGSITWSAITIADIVNMQVELNKKANLVDVYSKSEIDTKLTGIPTSGNVYTKSEIDVMLTKKARITVATTEDSTADFWFQEI